MLIGESLLLFNGRLGFPDAVAPMMTLKRNLVQLDIG
jgi:hypothetical protein